jgi:hypothetical protein
MAGTNTWDARGHNMSGSNDIQTRKLIFGWIKEHEKTFFVPRQPVRPIGIYFSQKSRNYFASEFIDSYRGFMLLLLQSHLEFQVVTPRTLASFHGDVLILPDVRCLSTQELQSLHAYSASGKALIATGETGKYDETGAPRESNPIREFNTPGARFANFPDCPGKAYYAALKKEFNQAAAADKWEGTDFDKLRRNYAGQVLQVSGLKPDVQIDASPFVSTQIARVDGKVSVFLANFAGLKSKAVAQQIPAQHVKITFSTDQPRTISFLPFLGQQSKIEGTFHDGKLSFEIPSIEKGAVVWLE